MNTPSLDIVGTDAYGSHQVGAQKAVYGKTGGSFSLAAGKTNLGHLEGRGFMVDGTWCFDTSSRFFKGFEAAKHGWSSKFRKFGAEHEQFCALFCALAPDFYNFWDQSS